MLTIARTLMGDPSLLLLDEPSEGLAPRIVEQMIEAIHEMKREGLGVFVSEQNIAFVRPVAEARLCHREGRDPLCGNHGRVRRSARRARRLSRSLRLLATLRWL
jgi:branched-chain amino acid transport system ATP-binding protein